jgi:hypothetical protein
MYSDEDRMRAVQLYIKLGKPANATIRWLGYPTKNALKHRHREFASGNECRQATCARSSERRLLNQRKRSHRAL